MASELDDLRRALTEIRDAWDADPALGMIRRVVAVADSIARARPLLEHTPPPRPVTSPTAERFARLSDAVASAALVDLREINYANVARALRRIARAAWENDSDPLTMLRARSIADALAYHPTRTRCAS